MEKNLLIDPLGRKIRYLRLSITDRCNFACKYCKVNNDFIEHENILRYEEMLELAGLAQDLGIEKIRLTGGEPFLRKGFPDFLLALRKKLPTVDLRITSNGTLVKEHIPVLQACNIHTMNISLDSFEAKKFADITGADKLAVVLDTIDALLEAKIKVKINVVALKNINDQELKKFLDYAYKRNLDIRFIEFMPIGEGSIWSQSSFWSSQDILTEAKKYYELKLIEHNKLEDGPAKLYTIGDSKARLGLISPLTNHYCADCNRLRVTSDGKLRTCLFDDKEYKLRPILRHKKLGVKFLKAIILEANHRKPLGNQLLQSQKQIKRSMTAIGG